MTARTELSTDAFEAKLRALPGIEETLPSTFATERQRGEILIGWVQLSLLVVFALLYAVSPKAASAHAWLQPVPMFLAAYFLFTLMRILKAHRGSLSDRFVALSILVDMALLFGLIWTFHIQYQQPASFYSKSPTFVYTFIFIALRALRFDARWVVFTGICAILGWVALAAHALANGATLTRDYVRYMTSNDLLLGADIDKLVVLAVATAILALVVHRARILLSRQVTARAGIRRLNRVLVRNNRVLQEEVTQRKDLQTRLERAAFQDHLTGIENRASLVRTLDALLRPPKSASVVVLVCDVDRFRLLNSAAGYAAGDEVLCNISRAFRDCVRETDIVARLGNDEFALLLALPGSSALVDLHSTAYELVARLRSELLQPLAPASAVRRLTACYGVAFSQPAAPARDGDALLRRAEIALERSKACGGDSMLVYESGWQEESVQRQRMELDLRDALDAGDLWVAYQPVVDTANGQVVFFEALLRWTHPVHGAIPPDLFIPIAEATGTIHDVGDFVLREALRQLAEWQRGLGSAGRCIGVSVNVSVRQLDRRTHFIERVRELLREHEVAAGCLHIELTESALMSDVDAVQAVVAAFDALGIRVFIDDFGTGYSSFALLPTLAVGGLKIDRSFLASVAAPGRGADVVQAIVAMARKLDLSVVAEGVETQAQLDALVAMGCPLAQGYLIARPLPAGAALDLLRVQYARHPTVGTTSRQQAQRAYSPTVVAVSGSST